MQPKLVVANYRGIRHAEWAPSGVCVLTGANGSGKTTLLSVLELLKNVYERGIAKAVEFSGGVAELRNRDAPLEEPTLLRLELGQLAWELRPSIGSYGIQMPTAETVSAAGRQVLWQEAGVDRVHVLPDATFHSSHESLLSRGSNLLPETFDQMRAELEVVENFRHYQNLHVWSLRTTGSPASSDTWLHPTGRNAFSVLRNWTAGIRAHRERASFVRDGLREAFPDIFDDLDFQVAGQTVALQFYRPGGKVPLSAFAAPSGMLVGLILFCAIASAPDGGVVCIDEPENSLHPYAIHKLIELARLRSDARGLTLLLASHSPVVLNEFNSAPDHIYVMAPERGGSPTALDQLEQREWLSQFALGDLYVDRSFGAPQPRP